MTRKFKELKDKLMQLPDADKRLEVARKRLQERLKKYMKGIADGEKKDNSGGLRMEITRIGQLPMLDALLTGKQLWDPKEPLIIRLIKMKEVREAIEKEHNYMLDHPDDNSSLDIGVILGALNLLEGLLSE